MHYETIDFDSSQIDHVKEVWMTVLLMTTS